MCEEPAKMRGKGLRLSGWSSLSFEGPSIVFVDGDVKVEANALLNASYFPWNLRLVATGKIKVEGRGKVYGLLMTLGRAKVQGKGEVFGCILSDKFLGSGLGKVHCDRALALNEVKVYPSEITLHPDQTYQLLATAYDVKGQELDCAPIEWSSEDPKIAEVNQTGLVMAVSPGVTYLVASVLGIEGKAKVTVMGFACIGDFFSFFDDFSHNDEGVWEAFMATGVTDPTKQPSPYRTSLDGSNTFEVKNGVTRFYTVDLTLSQGVFADDVFLHYIGFGKPPTFPFILEFIGAPILGGLVPQDTIIDNLKVEYCTSPIFFVIEHDFQIKSEYDNLLTLYLTFLPTMTFIPVVISNDPISIFAACAGAFISRTDHIFVGPELTEPELISILEYLLQQLEELGVRLIHINKDIGTELHTFRAEVSPELNKVLLFLDGELFFEIPLY